MDAIKHVIANIPDWLKRLDELNDQIEERQIALAAVSESTTAGSSGNDAPAARSIKNRGSTETLKPPDEPAAHPHDSVPQPSPLHRPAAPTSNPLDTSTPLAEAVAAEADILPPISPAGSNSPSALARQTNQVKAAAQARARAALRKRQRTESVVSAEGAMPKYRTRSMIIVYYDHYVQTFFEDLVKFVSASRNMMRKAKMFAKVAQIKRLAEMEMPDDEDDEEEALPASSADAPLEAASPSKKGDEEDLPVLRYVSTRRMLPVSRPLHAGAVGTSFGGSKGEPADLYDELDKGLEYVQSMCEHAAHQFLRDGDCAEEVTKIQRRLGQTKELADKEMERVKREDPDALSTSEDATKRRNFRPQSMRREHIGGSSARDVSHELEVDEALDDTGEKDSGIPKLAYKNTRLMR